MAKKTYATEEERLARLEELRVKSLEESKMTPEEEEEYRELSEEVAPNSPLNADGEPDEGSPTKGTSKRE